MRNAAIKVREYHDDNSRARTVPVSFALDGLANASLTIPALGGIPDRLTVVSNRGWWTNLALTMLDAGMIDPAQVRGKPDASMLVQRAFDKWVSQRLGRLNLIGLRIALSDELGKAMSIDELNSEVIAQARNEPQLLLDEGTFFLSNVPCEWGFVCIEKGVTALENIQVGLGRTLWSHLEDWMFLLGLNPVTPNRTEYHVSSSDWFGEDDEKEALAFYESEKDFIESGTLTRAEFDKRLPPFIVKAKAVVSWKAMRSLLNDVNLNGHAREIIALAFECKALVGKSGPGIFSDTGILEGVGDYVEQISPCVFVRWNLEDPTVEAFDNMARHFQEGGEGYYDGASGFDCISMLDAGQLRSWMKKGDRYLRSVRLIDAMLTILGEYQS